ncbi:RNA polymerase sigma factor [Allorhodopirellula heiligendammensis]|uniref:RNA polymerase sigma factor n=1 Tax=Allorhodopirellula heiligendammensis TaxID=2714739 RepID=UPI002660253F|nr:RNA polymerase sigma factor [Allorhodopirellula heiligendammensis]
MSHPRESSDDELSGVSDDSVATDYMVRQCLAGDRNAMARLYDQCSGRVYALMVRMVGRQDADDALQLAFMQIFRKLDCFRGESSLDTWIYRVATNEALQLLRRRKRRDVDTLSVEPESKISDLGLRLEDAEILEAGLAKLEPELRVVLTLKEVQDLSYAEIAEVMNIPEGTVGSRLNRARRELKAHLERLGWG